MPLLKRKPFALPEPPNDLEPHENVYQLRFTKEIFRDYNDYLNRLNQYRQRVWTCKITGKSGLTYEEALVSEKHATEKVQQIPEELVAPALRIIQYSMLPLKDLADSIAEKLQEQLFVGAQLYGKKNDRVHPCKILKVMQEDAENVRYVVAWLDENNNIIERAEVSSQDFVQKKPPFSRNILKSFIRESTYRNAPWVLHDKLAKKHGISTDIPKELRGKVFFNNGLVVCTKKRKNEEESIKYPIDDLLVKPSPDDPVFSSRPSPSRDFNVPIYCVGDLLMEESIKYPIDDLLVKPSPDDPVFSSRPSPSRDFNVPIYCVGDLLMVWDFFMSFGKLLRLWPYSLKDFENAISHKESNVVLLVESHIVLLRVLIKGDDEYSAAVQEKIHKKITMISWKDYLCDFLKMIKIPKLRQYEATIKRGDYGYVDVNAKLEIFRELVNKALGTAFVREKLDEFIEQGQVLGAAKREEAIEAAGKRRKEKEQLKADFDSYCGENGHHLGHDASGSTNNNHRIQNGDIGKNRNGEIESSRQKDALDSGIKRSRLDSKVNAKKLDLELNGTAEIGEVSRKESQKQPKGDKDQPQRSKEQRKEYFDREMEKWCIRTNPLGKDRYYNRYWWFHRDGKIFVESPDSKEWGYYSSKEELDALMSSLNCKGEREKALHKQLEKYYNRICSELQKSSKDLVHEITQDDSMVRRSTRVRAPPRENRSKAFLKYANKWKEEQVI